MLARVDHGEADAGPRGGATERLCIVTRRVRPVGELIRFVAGPDGSVVADLKRRLPGRGVWVTASRARVFDGATDNFFSPGFLLLSVIPIPVLPIPRSRPRGSAG